MRNSTSRREGLAGAPRNSGEHPVGGFRILPLATGRMRKADPGESLSNSAFAGYADFMGDTVPCLGQINALLVRALKHRANGMHRALLGSQAVWDGHRTTFATPLRESSLPSPRAVAQENKKPCVPFEPIPAP